MKFEKQKIIELARQVDTESIDNAFAVIDSAMEDTINIVANTAPISSKQYEFFTVNELSTGANTVNSDIDIILAVTAPQIELNTTKIEKKFYLKMWEKVKYAWKNRNSDLKKKKRKNKKTSENNTPKFQSKYNAETFRKAIINQLKYYFSEDTILYNRANCITIHSKKELGFNINIYCCLKDDSTNYKLYNSVTNKFTVINFMSRFEHLKQKCDETENKILDMIRLFNNLYYNINSENPNQILLESIFYNIPNSIFSGELHEIFVKCLNYLLSCNTMQDFVSIRDNKTLLTEDHLCKSYYSKFKTFLLKVKNSI